MVLPRRVVWNSPGDHNGSDKDRHPTMMLLPPTALFLPHLRIWGGWRLHLAGVCPVWRPVRVPVHPEACGWSGYWWLKLIQWLRPCRLDGTLTGFGLTRLVQRLSTLLRVSHWIQWLQAGPMACGVFSMIRPARLTGPLMNLSKLNANEVVSGGLLCRVQNPVVAV